MIGTVCNGIAAIVMCTFGTVEMLDPFEGAAVLYYGIPTESLGGSTPEQQQFIKHCLAVIGSLHVGMGVTLLLSTRGTPELQKTVALATIIGMLLHVATCLRVRPFAGHLVDPAAMPTGALLACVTLLGVGLVVENDPTDAERMNAIRIGAAPQHPPPLCAIPAQPVSTACPGALLAAEQKEFKGDMMENREYVKQLAEAKAEREAAKKSKAKPKPAKEKKDE